MAGVLGRLPLVLGFEDRAGEYSTRDFTVNLHGVGDVDGDSKVTFGRSIVLEMSTRTKE